MKFKPGISITGVRPEMVLGLMVADAAFESAGYPMIITSLLDGKHSATSLHYAGCAADLRTRHIPENIRPKVAERLKKFLGKDFDVVLEKSHIHVEWQPRRAG